jgi:hypothetical protein
MVQNNLNLTRIFPDPPFFIRGVCPLLLDNAGVMNGSTHPANVYFEPAGGKDNCRLTPWTNATAHQLVARMKGKTLLFAGDSIMSITFQSFGMYTYIFAVKSGKKRCICIIQMPQKAW